ncbi:CBS domain-containing protein [Fictibacillus iocasae]|uniref:CBS domain-containing protein n=1 Tax=Fictibacillus iocasae TaxID=2715437 RepID=A0ABW2NJE2_9BACL
MEAIQKKQGQLSDRFEIAFNQIHKCLVDEVGGKGDDRFKYLLDAGSAKHSLVRSFYDELCQFAKLRNAIVHEKTDHDFYIAEPHLNIVERIEQIAEYFLEPERALTIATKSVVCFEENETLRRVLECIKKQDYTRFPIYNSKGEYQWLLTASEILNWMTKQLNDNVIDLDDARIVDIRQKNKKKKHVEFMSKTSSIFKAEEIFENYHKENKKLEAIIITLSGKKNEKPLGIITSYDLIEIDLEN